MTKERGKDIEMSEFYIYGSCVGIWWW